MRSMKAAIRSLFKKGRKNFIKILSLGIGLAMGLVIISKVFFEQTYDDFYPDIHRIYQLEEHFIIGDEPDEFPQVSGGITLGMNAEIPEVEAATRIDHMGRQVFFDDSRNRFSGSIIMADTFFYKVLPRPVLVGDDKDILSRPLYGMVSEKMAGIIAGTGQNVVGRTIVLDQYPGRIITIGGIFKDIPENANLKYDIVLSMASFPEFYQYDCSEGWMGCDRFRAFVKLYPGVSPESLKVPIREMQGRHVDLEAVKQAGVDLWYNMVSLQDYHSSQPETKRMTILLSLIAFALIFTGLMNYILIVISSMVNRTKDVAVHKCYGASSSDISGIMLAETFLHLVLSLVLAVLLIFTFQGTIREILNASLMALFTPRTCLMLLAICALVFFIAGLVPSYLLTRIPVAAAFRSYKESRRIWKLVLLFTQFIACSFLVILLIIIGKQYDKMVNDNPGYKYENLLYTNLRGVSATERTRALEELKRLPQVEDIATSTNIPISGVSGNNVSEVDSDVELFNLADMENVSPNFLSLMEIPVLEGASFADGKYEGKTAMVNRVFAEKMIDLAGWTDGVVGKSVMISMHGLTNIIGVYENFRIGNFNSDRITSPSVMFYSEQPNQYFIIRMNNMSPESLHIVENVLKNVLPEKDVVVNYYKAGMTNLYNDSRLFRNSVLLGGLATLIIALIGLIGYTNDEINRRRSEIAVRKINGATLGEIQKLFLTDILFIAVPALILGALISLYAAHKWLESFSEKIDLSFFIFLAGSLLVLAIILAVVSINCYFTANDNPVNSLKSE